MSLPVRAGRPSDMAYVMDSWRRAYLEGSRPMRCGGAPAVVGADRDHYFAVSKAAIEFLCRNGSVRVAHDPEDDDHIVAFAAHGGKTFHFAAIKADFVGLVKLDDLLNGVDLDSYTYRCPYLERLLDGFRGSYFEELKTVTGNTIHRWHAPTGWRFTPRV